MPKKALETLYEAVTDGDIKGVDNIRLLRAVDAHLDGGFRDEFLKFRQELISEGISTELRIIRDSAIAKSIHGRYIYSISDKSSEIRFQLPPLNSLKANQWDTILTDVKVVPSFEEMWREGLDITSSWNEILIAVREYSERRAKNLEREAKRLRERSLVS